MKAPTLKYCFTLAFLAGPSYGQDEVYTPPVAPATTEARDLMSGVVLPEGFELTLFAAEPLLANPVAFAIDGQMRFFVAETFRLNSGVTDMREHMPRAPWRTGWTTCDATRVTNSPPVIWWSRSG
jgi:hypothetical protein